MLFRFFSNIDGYTYKRVATAGFIFLTSLLLAKIFDPAVFGQIAFFTYLIKFISVGQCGSETGFYYHYYNNSSDLGFSEYCVLYSIHLIIAAIVVFIYGVFSGYVYMWGSICFALLTPIFAMNVILRVNKFYGLTLLPDLLPSFIVFLSSCFYKYVFVDDNKVTWVFILSLAQLIFLMPLLIWLIKEKKLGLKFDFTSINTFKIKQYLRLTFFDGMPMFVGTLAFSFLLFIDRWFLKEFHSDPKMLGNYMMAFQLAYGSTIIVTSQNFISMIDIGECNKSNPKQMLDVVNDNFRNMSFIGAISFGGLFILTLFLSKYFLTKYECLIMPTISLGFGLTSFFVSGTVSQVLFYKRLQRLPIIGIFIITLLSVLHNAFVVLFKLPPIWVAYFTSFWLVIYSVFVLFYTYKKVRL